MSSGAIGAAGDEGLVTVHGGEEIIVRVAGELRAGCEGTTELPQNFVSVYQKGVHTSSWCATQSRLYTPLQGNICVSTTTEEVGVECTGTETKSANKVRNKL